MSKTFGVKLMNNASSQDAYPLDTLMSVLCYESLEECAAACKHYGLCVVDNHQSYSSDGQAAPCVLWRRSDFKQPTNAKTGTPVLCQPHKMVKTIEAKLRGATRLHICRGGAGCKTSEEAKAYVEKMREEQRLASERRAREETKRRLEEKANADKILREKERVAEEESKRVQQEQAAEQLRLEEKANADKILREKERVAAAERDRLKQIEAKKAREAELLAAEARKAAEAREAAKKEAALRKAEEERLEKEREEQENERRRLEMEAKAAEERRIEEERRRREEMEKEKERLRHIEELRKAEERRIEMEVTRAKMRLTFCRWRRRTEEILIEKRLKESFDCFDPANKTVLGVNYVDSRDGLVDNRRRQEEMQMQDELDWVHLQFLRRLSSEDAGEDRFSYDNIWKPDNGGGGTTAGNNDANPAPVLFKLGVVFVSDCGGDGKLHSSYIDATRDFIFSRLGRSWSGWAAESQERVEIVVREVAEGDDATGCNAALFVLPTVGANAEANASFSASFPRNAILGLKNIPRFLFAIGEKGLSFEGVWKRATCEAVGEENIGGDAIFTVERLTDKEDFESKLHDCLQGLIAYRVCGVNHGMPKNKDLKDFKVERMSINEFMRSVMRKIIWCGQLELEGSDVLGAVLRGVKVAGRLLSKEFNDMAEHMKDWPARDFSGGLAGVPRYFEAGGDLPLSWREKNMQQMVRWGKAPFLQYNITSRGGEGFLMAMLNSAAPPRGLDVASTGAACINVASLARRGLWRRGLEALLNFWSDVDRGLHCDKSRTALEDYVYLGEGVVDRVMAGVLAAVKPRAPGGRSRRRGRGRSPGQVGSPGERKWELMEWREANEVSDDRDHELKLDLDARKRMREWCDEPSPQIASRSIGGEDEDYENNATIIAWGRNESARKRRRDQVAPLQLSAAPEAEDEPKRSVLQAVLAEEKQKSAEFTKMLELMLEGDVTVNDEKGFLAKALKKVRLPSIEKKLAIDENL